uniref:Signal peptidase complex catalytic subunit SEC11 n=1 Tax=Scophthalmus maximus TaxID=52904 RepID=A0A8D3DBH8_SCOMX
MLSLDFLDDVRRMNKRQLYYQVLNFGMIVSSALMIWKGLMVVTGSESPIVVVLRKNFTRCGSMEPAFHRGDLLFLTNRVEDPIRVGEIVVFRIEGREIPIVHRVLKIHEKENGDIKFLTKGDNNAVDDRGLYKQGQHWLEKKDVVGRARGMLSSSCWDSSCWSTGSEGPRPQDSRKINYVQETSVMPFKTEFSSDFVKPNWLFCTICLNIL